MISGAVGVAGVHVKIQDDFVHGALLTISLPNRYNVPAIFEEAYA